MDDKWSDMYQHLHEHTHENSQKVSSFRFTSYKPPNEEKVFSSENHAANSKAA